MFGDYARSLGECPDIVSRQRVSYNVWPATNPEFKAFLMASRDNLQSDAVQIYQYFCLHARTVPRQPPPSPRGADIVIDVHPSAVQMLRCHPSLLQQNTRRDPQTAVDHLPLTLRTSQEETATALHPSRQNIKTLKNKRDDRVDCDEPEAEEWKI